ncbi:MAG: ABC-F family ATP-binding cassette domain-containing protein [Eubacterium sp.]|nr:ABC-F family ATP-binding cassette domain-containing protein [Eubacterium sp.]
MILACQNISKSFGDAEVLKCIQFHIEEHDKLAIVGVNGAGKTTLLRIILGEEEPDSGNVVRARDIRIGYLSQHQDISFDNTVYQEMEQAKKYLIDMESRLRELEADMKHAEGDELEKILETYNRLSTRYDHENGYAYESEITGVLKGLGFAESDYDRDINSLSGGQKMRIALGRLLLSRPDVILLDEPTNHLDMNSISWLEGFLAGYSGAVIVVSHDRYFIDRVSNQILEIEFGKSTLYRGNYSYYREQREKKRQDELKAYLNQQAEIRHEEDVIRKLKSFNREKSIKRAESREKLLDKVERIEKPEELRADMRLTLAPVTESGEDVLLGEHLKKAYGDNLLFQELGLDIKRGEHVALIGGNGTGKTTLLKILARKLAKDAGTVTLGARVRMGYFDQENQDLDPEKTLFDEMSDAFPEMTNTRIRNVLAAFLFTGDKVFQKIGDLSGGERGRLSLAKLMLSPANLLLLDEPTNHLDIQSKEILEDAIRDYTGTVLYVSHDRYFINRTATRILELRHKVLTNYPGNYDDYEENREKLFMLQHADNPNADMTQSTTRNGFSIVSTEAYARETSGSSKEEYLQRKESYAAERKRASDRRKLEKQIAAAEQELEEIEGEISRPENGTNAELLTKLTIRQQELEEQLLSWYEEIEEL